MTGPEAVSVINTSAVAPTLQDPTALAGAVSGPQGALDFGSLVSSGISHVEEKISQANDLVGRFAIDDSIPVHQVTIALEEARLAVELAVQVRSRLVEGYREIMNMQL